MENLLLTQAQSDIITFLEKNDELLFNERDLQMHLAVFLKETMNYDDVDIEYYVPYEELKEYIWKNELRIDVIVRKGDEYLPIELKYKTKQIKKEILRFGEKIPNIEVLKNQSAQDLGMYDFWKDVRRIELVRNRFPVVRHGLAIFVTNDTQYLNQSRPTSNNLLLNMYEGKHGRLKHWKDKESTCYKTHPDFEVENEYTIHWHDTKYESVPFHYCIIEV